MSLLTATTQDKMLPMVLDTVLRENVGFTRIVGAAKKGKWEGETLKKTIKVSKNTTGGFFTGYDLLDTTSTDNKQQLGFTPGFRYKTVSIKGTDLTVNAVSSTKVIDIAAAEMESTAQDLADDAGTDFYTGVGTGITMNGLANIVDDGGTAATYGGLTRATYTTLNSTETASGGTIAFTKMASLYNAITDGSQKPSIALCDRDLFSLIESLFTPQEQIEKDVAMMKSGLVGGTGYTGLYYKGFPIVADRKAVSGKLYFVNEEYLDFMALPFFGEEAFNYKTVTEGNDYGQPLGLGFTWDGWKKPINQKAVVSQITFSGNFISWNPRRHGVLTGVTSV